jgi:putative aminopeptidase FrvX
MPIPELLDRLLRAPAPAGREEAAAAIVREAAGAVGATVHADVTGSTVATLGEGRPLVAFVAHVDQVGMLVSHVGEDGLLLVGRLGGWNPAWAVGQRVTVIARDGLVRGVVGRSTAAAEKPGWGELYVDIGAADGDGARARVRGGDPIVLDAEPIELVNGRVAAGALDNRAGVWVCLEALRRLGAEPPPASAVALVAGTQEEIFSHAGALAGIRRLQPDLAVVVDVTYATDVPEGDAGDSGDHRLGGGPAIFRGPVVHPALFEALVDAAEAEGLSYTIESGERSMTDADAVFLEGEGVPTAVVSIPLRRAHSAVETVQLSDLEDAATLLSAFVRRLEPGLDLAR